MNKQQLAALWLNRPGPKYVYQRKTSILNLIYFFLSLKTMPIDRFPIIKNSAINLNLHVVGIIYLLLSYPVFFR